MAAAGSLIALAGGAASSYAVVGQGSVMRQGNELTGTGSRSGVTGGALFGGTAALARENRQLGRSLAIVRVYYRVGQTFPRPGISQLMAAGSTLLVSLDATPAAGPSYASIASGQQDAAIGSFLAAVNQAAVRYHLGAIYICFEHEADNAGRHAGLGSAAGFVAAWDHIHQLAQSAHLDWNDGGRLHWVWILTHVAFSSGAASSFWPGSSEVDVVAADGYNTSTCRGAMAGSNLVAAGNQVTTPAELFGPALSFARAQGGLPVFIAEWASVPYVSPAVQPGFIRQMAAYVAANPEIAAALYWSGHGQGNGCNYTLGSHSASLAALAAMGRSPYLQGTVVSGA